MLGDPTSPCSPIRGGFGGRRGAGDKAYNIVYALAGDVCLFVWVLRTLAAAPRRQVAITVVTLCRLASCSFSSEHHRFIPFEISVVQGSN